MSEQTTVEQRVRRQLEKFVTKSGGTQVQIAPKTDLIKDVGLTSLQGVEFVLDLCDEFEHEFPADFNPFVDDERERGQTFGGLVKQITQHLTVAGVPNGEK